MCFLVPGAIVVGGLITKFGRFRRFHVIAFFLLTISLGLFALLDEGSPKVEWAWFEIINAIGQSCILLSIVVGIQGALPEKDVAASTGFYIFVRQFASVWGVVIPGVIFNSAIASYIGEISDPSVRDALSHGNAYSYASSGFVRGLAPGTRDEVRHVFRRALKLVWLASLAFSGLGLVLSLFLKHVELRTELDGEYGLEEKKKKADETTTPA